MIRYLIIKNKGKDSVEKIHLALFSSSHGLLKTTITTIIMA